MASPAEDQATVGTQSSKETATPYPNPKLKVKTEPGLAIAPESGTIAVKEENGDAGNSADATESAKPAVDEARMRSYIIGGISHILGIFYGMEPEISTTDLTKALAQTELLVRCCKILRGEFRILSGYVLNALSHFGPMIYTAMSEEPYRWLRVASALQNPMYFREAMVHVVGTYPDHVSDELFNGLDPVTVSLIKRKARSLRALMEQTVLDLVCAGLLSNGERTVLTKDDKCGFDTVFIQQYWRSWFIEELHVARQTKKTAPLPGRLPTAREQLDSMHKIGALLRLLGKGGESYLPTAEVQDLMNAFVVPRWVKGNTGFGGEFCQWTDVATDLALFKDFAQRTVRSKGLLQNESMTGQFLELEYLTCTSIDTHEFPWVASGRGNSFEARADLKLGGT